MQLNNLTPFGHPDGTRAEIDEIQQGFVSFSESDAWGGIAMKDNDLSVRVIVGKKGAGKTIYLRRLQAYASKENSIYADDAEFDRFLPSTQSVIRIYESYLNHANVVEKWQQIWYAAVLRSIVSHLLHEPKLRDSIPSEKEFLLREIREGFEELYPQFKSALPVYSQVSDIVNSQELIPTHKLDSYLSNRLWFELENFIIKILETTPPVCFYLDAIDERFEQAPLQWLKCQEGLFYQTLQFLRNNKFGNRLHLVIGIRDIVYSSILRSEHEMRYYNSPNIRVLKWDKSYLIK